MTNLLNNIVVALMLSNWNISSLKWQLLMTKSLMTNSFWMLLNYSSTFLRTILLRVRLLIKRPLIFLISKKAS